MLEADKARMSFIQQTGTQIQIIIQKKNKAKGLQRVSDFQRQSRSQYPKVHQQSQTRKSTQRIKVKSGNYTEHLLHNALNE